ncbi:amidase domain-containing protein [Tumebacillus permanentifrigoris]|uniref:amidase domain-containing protein n=1 Tax=Tumebacillus permanentifrigoris TaxID=378543 RepID=UPI000D6CA9E9
MACRLTDQSYNWYYSSSWILTPDFFTYWRTTRGQTVYTWSASNRTDIINWAILGDVLQAADSSGVVVHSMIVTKVDSGHIYLTYHSGKSSLDRVDRPLSDIDISAYDRYYLVRFE